MHDALDTHLTGIDPVKDQIRSMHYRPDTFGDIWPRDPGFRKCRYIEAAVDHFVDKTLGAARVVESNKVRDFTDIRLSCLRENNPHDVLGLAAISRMRAFRFSRTSSAGMPGPLSMPIRTASRSSSSSVR